MTSLARQRPAAARLRVDDVEQRAIPGQLEGYWYTSRQEVPDARPAFDPNGALLIDPERQQALILIEFDGIWLPLSEAAERIYTGSRLIAEGQAAFFAVFPPRKRPVVYRLEGRSLLTRRRVADVYGEVAGRRARGDKKTVQVGAVQAP